MPHDADTAIKVATSAGAIFGQCIFGYLGDVLGRKKMYGVELMIIICTTLAQSLCGESATLSIVGVLIFYRVVMGIGVGGDCTYTFHAAVPYPLADDTLIIHQTRLVQLLRQNLPVPDTGEASSPPFSPCKASANLQPP